VTHIADQIETGTQLSDSLLRVLAATLLGLLALLAWIGLPFEIPYIGYGLVSAFIFQVAVRPRRWEMLAVVLGGGALTYLDQFIVPRGRGDSHLAAGLGFLGLTSFLVVGFRAIWTEGDERQQLKSILIPAAAFTFFVYASQGMLNLGGLLLLHTADLYAYVFDGSLGFQPSFFIGRLFHDYSFLGTLGQFTYYFLPVPMALVYAGHLRRKDSSPLFIAELFMAAGFLGYLLYLVFPAAGPRYIAGPKFPASPLSLSELHALIPHSVPVDRMFPRNAMPSLHMAWALLVWFNCQPFSRLARALALVFVVTTALDTLGTGEHYLIDLVVAFPFAVAVQSLCAGRMRMNSRSLRTPLVGGSVLTFVWLLLLRFAAGIFMLTPLVPWTCVILSTVLSSVWMRRVLSAENREPQGDTLARATAAGI
jgi:PAP2 superfamily